MVEEGFKPHSRHFVSLHLARGCSSIHRIYPSSGVAAITADVYPTDHTWMFRKVTKPLLLPRLDLNVLTQAVRLPGHVVAGVTQTLLIPD